ncbi:MAG: exosortase-dependent surface protein XDP2 [Halothece sp. Uz-M2-17]|nr:exosortase-dependent surface protein XDP2 [Halothece sp. Uz-M2-17]
MKHIKYLTAFSVVGIFVTSALPASAITNFTSTDTIKVTSPSGTNNAAGAGTITGGAGNGSDPVLTDDAFLDTLTFESGNSSFTGNDNPSTNSFRGVQRLTVVSGREGGSGSDAANVNGEFGENDDNSDGDDTPFHKAGLVATGDPVTDTIRESTDPDDQDAALLQALNNRNLAEIADGEGVQSYTLRLIFDQGINDDNNGNDDAPEIVLFERGINDDAIEIKLITGGTFEAPIFSGSTFSEASSNYDDTGLNLNTDEIGSAQNLGVIGLDLSQDFGLTNGDPVFGVEITSNNGGADINSALLASQDPSRFVDPPSSLTTPVPFEAEGSMGLVALGGYIFYRYRKNRKQT